MMFGYPFSSEVENTDECGALPIVCHQIYLSQS